MTRTDETLTPLLQSEPMRRGAIAVFAPLAPIDRLYSYLVPPELAERVRPGVRVRAPFGRGDRLAEMYCVEVSEGEWVASHRPVAEVIDDAPLLSPALLELAVWISRYYACPAGPTISAVAPAAARSVTRARQDWFVERVRLATNDEKLTAKQRAADGVVGDVPLALRAAAAAAGCGAAVFRGLEKKGLVRLIQRDAAVSADERAAEPDIDLNADQGVAAERIVAAMEAGLFRVLLLFGVTGSGKTEVYIRAMRQAIAARRQAMLLVPEIALTTQTVQRLSRRFPRVAVIHSGLTPGQRGLTWAAVARGDVDVIIGTRSAVFAPCARLGIIIVDEEQESSFKNQASPRYHTRDVAIKRAQIESIPIVLGSATPSLETWHNVGRLPHYELLRLPKRVAGLAAPRLHVVDMRAEHRARKGVHLLSRQMEQYLAATLSRGEQAVLLLNRRGYANYLFCPSCNTPVVCPSCGVFVVFHRSTDLAHCHYCGTRLAIPNKCAMAGCGGTLVRFGMGTERVEEEMSVKFPNARMARMDSDVMTKPAEYAEVLNRFERRELDVLVGTQMIAKGLDYPFVSCVGVVSADTALAISDFRSTERTFQLVLQVAGRSGRSDRGGDVVVQTFNHDLPLIRHALNHDYERFAAEELQTRVRTKLPPITRMVRIVLSDPRMTQARNESARLVTELRERLFGAGLSGDVWEARPCNMPRMRDMYRYEVVLVFESAGAMLAGMDRLRAENAMKARVRALTIDVDPISLQ